MTDRTERRTRLPSASLNKAFDNIDKSRKDAIKIFCIECVGCAAGYRGEIRNCTDIGCPLYPWRPYKSVEKDIGMKDSAVRIAVEEPKKKKKKKCCGSPSVLKLKNGRRECQSCGKKWKLKKKGI